MLALLADHWSPFGGLMAVSNVERLATDYCVLAISVIRLR